MFVECKSQEISMNKTAVHTSHIPLILFMCSILIGYNSKRLTFATGEPISSSIDCFHPSIVCCPPLSVYCHASILDSVAKANGKSFSHTLCSCYLHFGILPSGMYHKPPCRKFHNSSLHPHPLFWSTPRSNFKTVFTFTIRMVTKFTSDTPSFSHSQHGEEHDSQSCVKKWR